MAEELIFFIGFLTLFIVLTIVAVVIVARGSHLWRKSRPPKMERPNME